MQSFDSRTRQAERCELAKAKVSNDLQKTAAANRVRSMAFPRAYFEKDNDARTGSKGDYIFRDSDEAGTEIISHMFEMKNENDRTATKSKNEDFLKELDRDRIEKCCEYAILVSLLEPDNELYNTGIVDVLHRYPKMYVIRAAVLPADDYASAECADQLTQVQDRAGAREGDLPPKEWTGLSCF